MTVPIIDVGIETDQAAAINACLADSAVSVCELPAGLIWISGPVVVPSGKRLVGKGRWATTLKALPDFTPPQDSEGRWTNSIVSSEMSAVGVRVSDLAADASAITFDPTATAIRLNGTFMRRATGFLVERVDVLNCTGYGQFAQGDPDGWTVYASGTFRDCGADNCMIAFEQMACDGVTLEDCRAGDGAATITPSSYAHPLTGSRNITYRRFIASGAASVGLDIMANGDRDMANIRVEDSDFELTRNVPCLVTQESRWIYGLHLSGSRFVSANGLAAVLSRVRGTARGCTFIGAPIGVQFAAASVMEMIDSNSTAHPTSTSPNAAVYGISVEGGSSVRWDGGTLKGETAGTGAKYAVSGPVTLTSRTVKVPA